MTFGRPPRAGSKEVPRRRALALLAAAPAILGAHGRPAKDTADLAITPFANGAAILVAGPAGGPLDRIATLIAPTMAHALSAGDRLTQIESGGPDGVAGANDYAARIPPDGKTALLVPGDAALAWLSGDTRVHFDVTQWLPVLAGASPGVVAGRLGASGLARGSTIRIAAAGPAGPDMAALLALTILGVNPAPVFGLKDWDAKKDALTHGAVDLVFLHGRDVPARVRALSHAEPLFALGSADQDGAIGRDPLFPDLPHVVELYRRMTGAMPSGPLYQAWRAAAAAAQLDFALVLAKNTPPPLVAMWRHAGLKTVASAPLQAEAAAGEIRPVAGRTANSAILALAPGDAALLQLREWLARRFGWHPT